MLAFALMYSISSLLVARPAAHLALRLRPLLQHDVRSPGGHPVPAATARIRRTTADAAVRAPFPWRRSFIVVGGGAALTLPAPTGKAAG